MVTRGELIQTIHEIIGEDLIVKANQIDENANGVQIHGTGQVNKIALVSTSLDFFREAVGAVAQFTLTHHGVHLSHKYMYNARLDQSQQVVLKYIFAHNLTVAGYHYTLDAHPEIGNNATLIKLLGAKKLDISYFEGWGWVGEFAKPTDVKQLADKLANIAKDAGYNYFAAGHYATEVFGVQELGKKLKAHFKNRLAVEFIDIPNIL